MEDTVTAVLKKQVNILQQSENKRERKKALETIRLELENKEISEEQLIHFYEYAQKYLIFCFNDKSDACREEVFKIVIGIIERLPQKLSYLQVIILALTDRFTRENVSETFEEVRLLVVKLLRALIAKYQSNLLIYLDNFINILVKTLIDNDPKVKKESCETVSELAKALPEQFHLQVESLIKPILQNLTHQHYRVRVSGICAIGDAVRYGNSNCVEMSCGPLAERLFDQNPFVRIAVARVVGMWLLELPDRYSFFYKIIPLMLTCLVDEIPELSAESTILWNKAGAQYLLENENDLKDKMDFLAENLDHFPDGVSRPSLGCRTLVQRELSKYLPAVIRELEDWMLDVRVRSAQLLCVSVQHAEEHITQHLQKVLPVMYKAFTDDGKGVRINIERTAEMIGYFVPASVYCQLILPSVEENSKSGALGILAAIIKTTKPDFLKEELHNIARVVHSVCQSKQLDYQEQLLNTVSALISTSEHDCSLISQEIFTVLISVIGLAVTEGIINRAKGLLEGLSTCEQITMEELFIKHTPYILDKVICRAEKWSVQSPERFVFEAIITHTGSAIGLNMDIIIKCLNVVLRSDAESEISLKMLLALSHILVNSADTLRLAPDRSQIINKIIKDILCPQLVWKAGRSAEVLRNAAISDLVVALQILHADELSIEISLELIPLLLSLVEDTMSKTRKFSIISLSHIVEALRESKQLTAVHINSIWIVVIKRLDDNNNEVRHIAVKSLCTIFCLPMPENYVEHHDVNLKSLYSEMLVHLNDPDASFQEIMLDALKKVAAISPQILRNEILNQSFSETSICKTLLLYLENL